MKIEIRNKLDISTKFLKDMFNGDDLPDYKDAVQLDAHWYLHAKKKLKFLHLRAVRPGNRGEPMRTAVIARVTGDLYVITWVAKSFSDKVSVKKTAAYYATLKLLRGVMDMVRNGVNADDPGKEKKPGFTDDQEARDIVKKAGLHHPDGIKYEKFSNLDIALITYEDLKAIREEVKVANAAAIEIGNMLSRMAETKRQLLPRQRSYMWDLL
jgi:hypothetical protein